MTLKLLGRLFPNQDCWMFGLRRERYFPSSLELLRVLPPNARRRNRRFWAAIFLFVFVGGNTYTVIETTLSLSLHGFGKISLFEGEVFPILYFSGKEGHMRHNAFPFSGSIGTSCGTQRYLPYDPNGDFSKRHIIGKFIVCL